MRVAFIGLKGLPTPWTGVEHHVERLGRGLVAAGHEVTAYVRPSYTPPGLRELGGIRLRRLPTVRSKHLDASVHTLLSSVDATFRRFELIHYHCIGPGAFSFLPRLSGRRVVCTVHRLDWQAEKWGWFARCCLRAGERATVLSAHRLIVVSQELQQYFRERYGCEAVFIPNGSDPVERRRPHDITERWGLKGDDYVLFVGRLSPEKRVDCLVQAFRALDQPRGDGTHVKLVVAGGFNATEEHVATLRKLAGDDPTIIFTGFVTGPLKEELFSNAALFVLPSRIEGMPIVLLEARQYGLCCLASDIAPHRAIVRDGIDGRLFAADDSTALAVAMGELLADPAVRYRLGEAGRQRAAQRPSWGAVVAATEAVYRTVAARGH